MSLPPPPPQKKKKEKNKESSWYRTRLFISFNVSAFTFFRGPVVRVDSAGPSTGNILLSPDKRRLVWDVGQCINNFRIYLFVGFYSQGIAETIPPEILPKKKSAHIRRGKHCIRGWLARKFMPDPHGTHARTLRPPVLISRALPLVG